MNNQLLNGRTPCTRRLRLPGKTALLVLAAAGSSTAFAGSGYIPYDGYPYPESVTPVPAVVGQCMACHGPNAQSPYDDWPSLAGQKKTYLLQQLKDFKSGERSHPMMLPVVASLTEADMQVLSEYLSSQPPAQPAASSEKTAAPAAAAACAVCHDNPQLPVEPYINGQQAGYLDAQLRAFRSGTRKDPIMNAMTQNLTDQEIADLAAYFSSQPPVAQPSSEAAASEP